MRRIAEAAVLLYVVIVPAMAAGQNTPRTIEAVPAELAGVVRDSLGNPVRDAEVNVPLSIKSTHTDRNGAFALVGMAPNVAHDVWFRRIGFESVRFVWKGEEGKRVEIAVTLHRLPNTLNPTVVWANETKSLASTSMVSGVVVDSAGVPVAGADVQLIGAERSTKSAEDGTFEFRQVPPGTVTLRARRMAYAPTALMIELEKDDQRDVAIRIRRLVQTLETVNVTEESGYGKTNAAWLEFGRRERWRTNSGLNVTLGPKRLREAGGMPLDWLMKGYAVNAPTRKSAAPRSIVPGSVRRAGLPETVSGGSCILENGITFRHWPGSVYSADELDRVEYYPAEDYSGTIEPRMHAECRSGPDGRHPPWLIVWLKGAR